MPDHFVEWMRLSGVSEADIYEYQHLWDERGRRRTREQMEAIMADYHRGQIEVASSAVLPVVLGVLMTLFVSMAGYGLYKAEEVADRVHSDAIKLGIARSNIESNTKAIAEIDRKLDKIISIVSGHRPTSDDITGSPVSYELERWIRAK